jgi:glycosyltransferase involved in cell wall biosynthesis
MHTSAVRVEAGPTREPPAPRALDGVQGWVDEVLGSRIVGDEMRITGWCFFPDAELRCVRVLLGSDVVECEFGRFRADVAAAHPGHLNALQSGFEAAFAPRRPWEGFLAVQALLADGRIVGFQSDRRVRIIHRPWHQKIERTVRRLLTPRARIRTLCVTNDLNITGGPLYLAEIIGELKRREIIEPIVISPRDGWLRKEFENTGIEVRIRDRMLEAGSLNISVDRLAREFARERAEVIYVNTLDCFPAVSAAKEAGIPSFWNIHESQPWHELFARFAPPVDGPAVRQLFSWPHRVMFSSEATRSLYRELEGGNFCVLANAVDDRRIQRAAALHPRNSSRQRLGISDDEVMLLLLGTVCERKGQLDLVEALALLPEQTASRVRCFVVGDRAGAYSDAMHRAIAALPENLRRCVTVVAETPETALYFGAADVFVCTSRIESFPRVILEAMHYRLPIVTTGVFGIRSQVEAGVNGIFYEPGDACGLCDAIVRLLNNAPARRRMGDQSHAVLAKLGSFDQMVEGYGRVLRAARGGAGKPS